MMSKAATPFTAYCDKTIIGCGLYGGNFAEYRFWEKYMRALNKRSKALGLNSHHYINIGF